MLAIFGLSAASPAAWAEPSAGATQSSPEGEARPSVVALWIDRALSPERRASLERLVRAELGSRAVTLEVNAGDTPLAGWIQEIGRDRRVLLAAALDADESGWKFYIVHVARGESMERRLPGGADADAAALEAVATILDSAVSALHEGLGRAEQSTPPPPESSPAPAPPTLPVRTEPPEPESPTTSGLAVRGGLGVAGAALGDALVAGGSASLALRFGHHFGMRAATELYLPKQVSTPYGKFRFQRSVLDLRAQALLPAAPFTLMPELGLALEIVRRSGAAPGPGVTALPSASHLRGGGVLGLRASYPAHGLVALELGVHIEGFTRAVHFLAAGSTKNEIFALEPLSVAADVGVSLGQR